MKHPDGKRIAFNAKVGDKIKATRMASGVDTHWRGVYKH